MTRDAADVHDLRRFVEAQERVYDDVMRELRAGSKQGHWMWFVFPQLRGLGQSAMAQKYGIATLAEAKAYLDHELLGPRLEECVRSVTAVQRKSAHEIFGYPDDMKFRSCMTLFAQVAPAGSVFDEALNLHFSGEADQRTLDLIAARK